MNTKTWQEIRALRAASAGRAAEPGPRRQVFAAALRQAEELADAAQAAGYAARPLPLFYSLSQAGRAIAAAHLPGDGWQLRGHGLSPRTKKPLLETTVEPVGSGGDSFSGVADAIGSPPLSGKVELGALWAANPDLRDVRIPGRSTSWLPPVEIPVGRQRLWPDYPGEPEPDPETERLTTGGMVSVTVDLPGETGAQLVAACKPYPTLHDLDGLRQGPSGGERAGPDDRIIRSAPPDKDRATAAVDAPQEMTRAAYWRRIRELTSFVDIDESRPVHPAPSLIGYALPEMAGGPCPHPLMLWWALLLGLSSLARYEPAGWIEAIDLDNSELAVSLERILDVASERVPARVLESLQGVRL